MLIDCHTHAFADKIAERAVAQLIAYYNIHTTLSGRLDDLINAAVCAKLDAIILLVAATKPEQVKPANDWILSLAASQKNGINIHNSNHSIPKIYPFGTFHLNDPLWRDELQRLKSAGIKGIKIHPEFQGIDLADPGLNKFFEELKDDFLLMIHIGDPVVSPNNLSTPRKVANILKNFPKLQSKIIAAHLGGYRLWDEACQELAGKELFFDISSTLPYIEPSMLKKIVLKHGVDKILFGSDYPLRSPEKDLILLEQIAWLSTREKELIKGENCAKLLQ